MNEKLLEEMIKDVLLSMTKTTQIVPQKQIVKHVKR